MRDLGISNTLALKSNALRDIAINNAILKRQEQQSAISGLQGFLNSERGEAWNKSGLNERAFAYNQSINDYNHAVSVAKRKGWINLGEQAAIMGLNAYMPGLGTATSGATGLGK